MRIERTGKVEPLTPRVMAFLETALHGVSLDDVHSVDARRIDYSCMHGLLAVELKTLEEPGTGRIDNLTDELRQRDDWPMFLGSAPLESFIANTGDPDGIRRQMIERVGRAIINHLKKANRQFEAHAADFPRKNMVKLLVLVNEDHEIYDPHTVSYILWHAVRREKDDRPLYEHVDAIFYLTQRHATVRNDKLAYPIMTVEGEGCYHNPWKGDVIARVAERWAGRNGYEAMGFDSVEEFTTIDHIPDQAPRHERWRTEYKRAPYLSGLTKEQLRDRFDEVNVLSMLSFLKNPPIKLDVEQSTNVIRQFGDLTLEMGNRGIPITEFRHERARELAAARRLGMPDIVFDWLAKIERQR